MAPGGQLRRREEAGASLQYLFRQDDTGYVLTFSTLPSLATKYEPTFNKSARSFQID